MFHSWLLFLEWPTYKGFDMGKYLKCYVILYFQVHYDEDGKVRKDPPPLHPRPKQPYSIHAWAAITMKGATHLKLFTGCVDSGAYIQILETELVPFLESAFPEGHRFQQDNAPAHTRYSSVIFSKFIKPVT